MLGPATQSIGLKILPLAIIWFSAKEPFIVSSFVAWAPSPVHEADLMHCRFDHVSSYVEILKRRTRPNSAQLLPLGSPMGKKKTTPIPSSRSPWKTGLLPPSCFFFPSPGISNTKALQQCFLQKPNTTAPRAKVQGTAAHADAGGAWGLESIQAIGEGGTVLQQPSFGT